MANFMRSRLFSCFFPFSQYRAVPAAAVLSALMLFSCGSMPANGQSVSSFGFQMPIPLITGSSRPAPNFVALDASGNLFVSDFSTNNRVLEVPVGCASTSC